MISLGLIGHPVAHSLSPKLHLFFMQQLGLAGTYTAWDTPTELLEKQLKSLWNQGLEGLNITVPHKASVLAHVTSQSSVVACVGAANTLLRADDGWHAENTDITGFWASLPPATRQAVMGGSVWILGAGGSAKAVVASLCHYHVGHITVISRSHDKAQPLIDWITATAKGVSTHWHPWGTQPTAQPPVLIINATSIDLSNGNDTNDFDWLWQTKDFTHTTAMDLMYRLNRPTTFVASVQHAGCLNALDGLGMLVHQGADAFTLWTGNPVTADLRQSAYSHLLPL
ncbi:MAG: shikimate dehydrogenase [Vampirovibrionales bacterium]|nr:shikimate dehydrogenase [Vampirovibrionales bacterium]